MTIFVCRSAVGFVDYNFAGCSGVRQKLRIADGFVLRSKVTPFTRPTVGGDVPTLVVEEHVISGLLRRDDLPTPSYASSIADGGQVGLFAERWSNGVMYRTYDLRGAYSHG
jgi:hypothetical protein